MPQPFPSKKVLSDLKASILNPAQTSHFQCWFNPPNPVKAWVEERADISLGNGYTGKEEFFSLSCSEASLPGSSLATHDITNDYQGVTERMAYRRIYDDVLGLTFYVDRNYNTIKLFERWIDYISGITDPTVYKSPYTNQRVSYPSFYKSDIFLSKFEKDHFSNESTLPKVTFDYTFVKAFPRDITAIPLSYEQGQILKCNVSFSFIRYVVEDKTENLLTTF